MAGPSLVQVEQDALDDLRSILIDRYGRYWGYLTPHATEAVRAHVKRLREEGAEGKGRGEPPKRKDGDGPTEVPDSERCSTTP